MLMLYGTTCSTYRTYQLLYATSTPVQLGHTPCYILWHMLGHMLGHMLLHIETSPEHLMLLPGSVGCTSPFNTAAQQH